MKLLIDAGLGIHSFLMTKGLPLLGNFAFFDSLKRANILKEPPVMDKGYHIK